MSGNWTVKPGQYLHTDERHPVWANPLGYRGTVEQWLEGGKDFLLTGTTPEVFDSLDKEKENCSYGCFSLFLSIYSDETELNKNEVTASFITKTPLCEQVRDMLTVQKLCPTDPITSKEEKESCTPVSISLSRWVIAEQLIIALTFIWWIRKHECHTYAKC